MQNITRPIPTRPDEFPAETSGSLPHRLLGVWAHPDDEAYLSAGLMAEVIAAGGEVTVPALTNGELGFADDDPRTLDGRSFLRRAEIREAMATIGVTDIRFVGAPDGFLDRLDTGMVADAIRLVMEEVRPDLTVTFGPDGITGHLDHVACGLAATAAWLAAGIGELRYAAKTTGWLDEWRSFHDEVGIWMTDEPTGVDSADLEFVVRLGGAALDDKREVLAHHASQTEMLAGLMGEADYRHWISEEAFRRPTTAELNRAVVAAEWGGPWTPKTCRPVVAA
jgi:LmbE family N-acetylglucosaminyl deacetylase